MSELGNLLLSLMQEKGLSYGILSNMTGISKATLQRYVSGTTETIPFDRLEIIAKALGVNVGYLCAKSTINEMKLRGEYTSEMMELFLDAEQEKSRADLNRASSPDEQRLLDLYRALNEEGQEKLVDYADDLVTSGKYIKSNPAGMVQEK